MVHLLPHINVSLNALATLLLVVAFVLIKQKREEAHKKVMLATVFVSGLFLCSYLIYHFNAGSKRFPTDTDVAPLVARYFYYFVLLTHVLLAAVVPILVVLSVALGLKGNRAAHKRVVKWAWPIWLYVSVTGIVVYVMLYQMYVPTEVAG